MRTKSNFFLSITLLFVLIFSISVVNAEIQGKIIKVTDEGAEDSVSDNFENSRTKFTFSNGETYERAITSNGEYSFNPNDIYCWEDCNIFPNIYLDDLSIYEENDRLAIVNIPFSNALQENRQNIGLSTSIFTSNKVDVDITKKSSLINNDLALNPSLNKTEQEGTAYSVFWQGILIIPEENNYNFYADVSGEYFILIDNQTISEEKNDNNKSVYSKKLSGGNHTLEIRYYTLENYGKPNLYWSSENINNEIVSKENLIFVYGGSKKVEQIKMRSFSASEFSTSSTTYPSGTWYYYNTKNTAKRPVLLVHGWGNDEATSGGWGDMPRNLEDNGLEMLELVYNPANLGNKKNAGMFYSIMSDIRNSYTSFTKIDVVAYSMGTLVTRGYIQNLGLSQEGYSRNYQNDIRKLVLIAGPMYGTYRANQINDIYDFPLTCEVLDYWFMGLNQVSEATKDMELGSDFIWELNNPQPNSNIEYLTIGGFESFPICLFNNNQIEDGVVPMTSSNLLKYNIPHITLERPHKSYLLVGGIKDNYQTEGIIDDFINGRGTNAIKENLDYSGEYYIDPDDANADYQHYQNKGRILISFSNKDVVTEVKLYKNPTWYPLTKNPRTKKWFYLNWAGFNQYSNELGIGTYDVYYNDGTGLKDSGQDAIIEQDAVTFLTINNIIDSDSDGIADSLDNCPTTYNPNQANNDGDSQGDVCDSDDDNDGVLDTNDACQFIYGTYCHGCSIPSCQQGYAPSCPASGVPVCIIDTACVRPDMVDTFIYNSLVFCPGVYNATPGLTIMNDNIIILCNQTTLRGDNNPYFNAIYSNHKKNLTIGGCRIESYTYGIELIDSPNSKIYNNILNNITWGGLRVDESSFTKILNNSILNSSNSIGVGGGVNYNISNNFIKNSDSNYAITLSWINNSHIDSNTIISKKIGMNVFKSNNNIFSNNTLNGSYDYTGFELFGDNNKLINNKINNYYQGIYVLAKNNFILSNFLYNNTNSGLVMYTEFPNSYNNTILNNTLYITGIWDRNLSANLYCLNGTGNNYFNGATGPVCDVVCVPQQVNTSWSWWTNLTCSLTQMNQSRFKIQYDNNSCGTIQNQTFYEYQLVGPNYLNTTWTAWNNISCLFGDKMNQTRNLTQYDIFSCAENKTIQDYQANLFCDFCKPNLLNTSWSNWVNLGSCTIKDIQNQSRFRVQYDNNSCGEISNQTFYEYNITSCDFCNYTLAYTNWTEWQNQTECINGNLIQNRSRIEFDLNYQNCYAITNLPSDLWNNGENKTYWEFNNTTCEIPCYPNLIYTSWSNWQNLSCLSSGKMNQSRYKIQYESENCSNYQNQTIYDYQAIENCDNNSLSLNNPNPRIYNDRRLNLNLNSNVLLSKLNFIDYAEENPRWTILCTNCKDYNRTRSFDDGVHNITFMGTLLNGQTIINKTEFFIDSKLPSISKTEPRINSFTNGSEFYIKFREDNIKNVTVIFNPIISLDLNKCTKSRSYTECYIDLNLSNYNNQVINYSFTVEDIAGNKDESRPTKIKVDTTSPLLNNPDSFWTRGLGRYSNYIYFDMSITETNFDEAILNYDYNGRTRERRWCSRLKEGKCEYKFRLNEDYSDFKLIIKDEAGNSYSEELNL